MRRTQRYAHPQLETLELRTTPVASGGLSVAAGDFNRDGYSDLAFGAGIGQLPRVQIVSGRDGQLLGEYSAYDDAFTGGVNVAIGDINGDGTPDLITAPNTAGGPHVKVFNGANGQLLESYFAYAPDFTGGVNLASGDVDSDGMAEVITGAGVGGGPHIRVFQRGGQVVQSYFAFDSSLRGGAFVASAELDQDGAADVVTGAGPGGGPHVRAFSGRTNAELASFFAFEPSFSGGVTVSADRLRGLPAASIITGAASNGGPHVKVFTATGGREYGGLFAYDAEFSGGVRLASADINGDEIPDIISAPGPGGGPHVRMLDGATGNELAGFFALQAGQPSGGFSQRAGSTNAPDTDGDQLPDAVERAFFGTASDNFDSDQDFMPDGIEVRTPGLSPTSPDDAAGDLDSDRLTNLNEVIYRTRLDRADTDADGVGDADEVGQGSDPLDGSDSTAPDPSELVELRLSVGDDSGSHSERYNLIVGNVVHQAPEFGVVSTGQYKFRRGRDYPIQIVHRGTDPNYTDTPRPDYDYFAAFGSPAGSLADVGVTIEDADGILGNHNESDSFFAAGKSATLRVQPGPVRGRLESVKFINPAATILRDDGTGAYTGSHWDRTQTSARPTPVVFVGGTKPRIRATFTIDAPDQYAGHVLLARAKGLGNIKVVATQAVLNGNQLTVEADTESPLAEQIDKLEGSIEWEVTAVNQSAGSGVMTPLDQGATTGIWSSLGSSQHTVYATFATPTAPKLFETMLDVGTVGARRATAPDQAVAQLFNTFRDLDVRRRDGVRMTFWATTHDYQRLAQFAEDMLARPDGDGACGAWAELLDGAIKGLGISGSAKAEFKVDQTAYPGAKLFLVRNWEFVPPVISSRSPIYQTGPLSEDDLIHGEAVNLTGRPGQGSSEPPSMFGNHFIVMYNGTFYDPSFGISATNPVQYESQIVAGLLYPNPTLLPEFLQRFFGGMARQLGIHVAIDNVSGIVQFGMAGTVLTRVQ